MLKDSLSKYVSLHNSSNDYEINMKYLKKVHLVTKMDLILAINLTILDFGQVFALLLSPLNQRINITESYSFL